MGTSGKRHAQAMLYSRERTPSTLVQEAGWASELVWTQRMQEKSFVSDWKTGLDPRQRQMIFRLCSDRLWGPPSLLPNRYWGSFPGVKRGASSIRHPGIALNMSLLTPIHFASSFLGFKRQACNVQDLSFLQRFLTCNRVWSVTPSVKLLATGWTTNVHFPPGTAMVRRPTPKSLSTPVCHISLSEIKAAEAWSCI
jgi:hypothetical protein